MILHEREIDDFSEIPVLIIENKHDLPDSSREVSIDIAQEIAKEHKAHFMQTSAKTKHNLDEAIQWLVESHEKLNTPEETPGFFAKLFGSSSNSTKSKVISPPTTQVTVQPPTTSSKTGWDAIGNDFQNLVVLGGGGVGKSASVIRFIQNQFVDEYDPTIEDSYRKVFTVDGHTCHVDILDTAGQEEFSSMKDMYMRDADCFFIMYAANSRSSFDEVEAFIQSIKRVRDIDDLKQLPTLIVHNKTDLDEFEVMISEGEALASAHDCHFMATSAKLGTNIVESYEEIFRMLVKVQGGKSGSGENGPGLLSCCQSQSDDRTPLNDDTEQEEEEEDGPSLDQHSDAIWKMETYGDMLLTCSRDHSVRLWELPSSNLLANCFGHTDLAYGAKFAINIHGDVIGLYSCSADGSVIAWHLDGEIRHRYSFNTKILHLHVTQDHMICCGTNQIFINQTVDFNQSLSVPMDLATIYAIPAGTKAEINGMLVAFDLVWVATSLNTIIAFGLDGQKQFECEKHTNYVNHLTTDGQYVYSASADATVCMWTPTGQFVRQFSGHTDWVNCLEVKQHLLFTGSRDTTGRVFDIHTGKCLHLLEGSKNTIRAMAVDMESRTVSLAGKDKAIYCFNFDTGQRNWDIEGHDDWINSIKISHDMVISGSKDSTMRGWDLEDGVITRVFGSKKAKLKGLLVPKLKEVGGFVSLIVDFMQLTSFAFTANLPWQRDHPAQESTPLFQFSFDLGSVDFQTIFWLCWSLAMLSLVLFFFAKEFFARKAHSALFSKLWLLTFIVLTLCSGPLFIPIMRNLMSVLICNPAAGYPCWATDHITMVIMGCLIIPPFLLLMMRMVGVGGDVNKVSVFWRWTWKFDKADLRKVHQFSLANVAFTRAFLVIKVLLIATVIFLIDFPLALTNVLVIMSLLIVIATIRFPPYHSRLVNVARAALLTGVFWTSAYSIAVVVEDDPASSATTLIHMLIEPAFIILGGLAMFFRLQYNDKESQKNTVEDVELV